MSIIYNALKKTQQTHQETPEATEQVTEFRVKTTTISLASKIGMGLLGLTIGILPFMLIIHLHHTVQKPVTKKATTQAALTLKLNGVFLTTDDKVAVIDNKEYHIGENIEGMKIVSMDINSVTLQRDDDLVKINS